MSKILFNQEPSNTILKGEEIQYSQLKVGINIVFEDENGQNISGQITELYTNNDEETDLEFISGCLVKASDGEEYELFEENEEKIWVLKTDNKQKTEEAMLKEENKIERKPAPNLFQGRTEAEKGNAKFPDWDIVPPNQFINPRIKTQ